MEKSQTNNSRKPALCIQAIGTFVPIAFILLGMTFGFIENKLNTLGGYFINVFTYVFMSVWCIMHYIQLIIEHIQKKCHFLEVLIKLKWFILAWLLLWFATISIFLINYTPTPSNEGPGLELIVISGMFLLGFVYLFPFAATFIKKNSYKKDLLILWTSVIVASSLTLAMKIIS